MQKTQSVIIGIAAVALVASLASIPMFFDQTAEAKNMSKIRMQETVASIQDPFPGHESHDIAIIFPPEQDVLYSGTLTFSASRPVEIVVWHEYEQPEGAPANIFQVQKEDGTKYAFSLIMLGEKGEDGISEAKGGVRSASTPFAGSGLAVHTLDGEPFTVSYSVDGWKRILQN
ncbi:MAG: hypothetical protein ACR2LL_06955 [Nitrosopumilus sp.]